MKMYKLVTKIVLAGVLIYVIIITSSCASGKKLRYFNDIDTMQAHIVNPREHKLIMPFDRLSVQVFSTDEKTKELFKDINAQTTASYTVDKNGDITFPLAGKINVRDLTTEQAGIKLEEVLSSYVTEPDVTITVTENMVTVMGEVNSQGSFSFNQDKLNIYEALALGGGITVSGNRKAVVLIRQNGNDIKRYKLDLSDSRIAEKDLYYIESNDVIIVEPLRTAAWTQNSGVFMSLFSILSSFLALYTMFSLRY